MLKVIIMCALEKVKTEKLKKWVFVYNTRHLDLI